MSEGTIIQPDMVTVTLPREQWEAVVKALNAICPPKPEPKKDYVRYLFKNYPHDSWAEVDVCGFLVDVIQITRDGETNKIKKVELIG